MAKSPTFGLFHSGAFDEFFVSNASDVIPKFDKSKIDEYYEQEDNFYSFNETHEELEKLPRAVLFHDDEALLEQYQQQLITGKKTIDDIVLHREGQDENGTSVGGHDSDEISTVSVILANGSDIPESTVGAEIRQLIRLNEETARERAETQAAVEDDILRLFKMTEESAHSLLSLRQALLETSASAPKAETHPAALDEEESALDDSGRCTSSSDENVPTVADGQPADPEESPDEAAGCFGEQMDALVGVLTQLLHLVDMLIKLLTQLLQQVKQQTEDGNSFYRDMKQQLARIVFMLTPDKSYAEVDGIRVGQERSASSSPECSE